MSLKLHPGEYYVFPEDDLPESQSQIELVEYMTAVLKYFYAMQPYFVTGNLTILPPGPNYPFRQIVPNIMVVEGVTFASQEDRAALSSWDMKEPGRAAPRTIFEFSSENTWSNDLDPKPEYYRLLGVQEYFAYDPQRYWPGPVRLRGWRYVNGQTQEIAPQSGQSRLWSETLNSWVESVGVSLRLTDSAGNLRLTGEQAAQQAQAAEQAALEELLEKLRRHNIDPDKL